jgi:tripartite-type tricarboxylate transporter receptor subunit TctC
MRVIHHLACAFAVSIFAVLTASATPLKTDGWPQRTVRVIVPLPPGSSTDVAARHFAEKLAERWHQPVIIENRQGADGIPAAASFAAAHDDHTLLCSFAGIVTINPLNYDKLPYDPASDLVPIASIADNFLGFAVSEKLQVKSVDQFVALARTRPGKLNWAATPGVPLYAFAALEKAAGINLVQIVYRDFNPALLDAGEGRIQAVATGILLMLPHVQAGKIRLLMLHSRQRSPQTPEVPTAHEAGYPELTFDGIVGFYGWRDMPADLKQRIADDVRAVSVDPAIAVRLANSGSALRVEGPEAFAAIIDKQRRQIAAIARSMKPTQ